MCLKLHDEIDGSDPAPPRDELLKVLDSEGFPAMQAVANNCPACILSALRARNVPSELGPYRVSGPEDGRNDWDYGTAKREWWNEFNAKICELERY